MSRETFARSAGSVEVQDIEFFKKRANFLKIPSNSRFLN
jgi:hypothetical protein